MRSYWVGVASRDHVRAAVRGGFAQLNHGKEAPIRRLTPGDRILYYSPRVRMREGKPVQAFTAIGEVLEGEPHQVSQSEEFARSVGTFDISTRMKRRSPPSSSTSPFPVGWRPGDRC